ncbi:hypothetical protein PACTADRAFT_50737 [Pachysolen tannophilus NRRL Y-2460]|uniref:Uncharacterized protein n=1 Tax=Pachysolen tannophilus NRRL Y-2460 TaxID=669874 RepID=A0A1E4TT09_PACTA|nr:hypothetical protein PACTADRAFT_50737 [Pachysolen tannophilus NRRL Y-2460]
MWIEPRAQELKSGEKRAVYYVTGYHKKMISRAGGILRINKQINQTNKESNK